MATYKDSAGNEYTDGIDPDADITAPIPPAPPPIPQPLYAPLAQPRTAHRCPVCGGRGIVPTGFYDTTSGYYTTTTTAPEGCRSCGGRGVVWG